MRESPAPPASLKLGILCQEEPVFLGPFLRRVMEMRPEAVGAVFVAGRRSAGERTAGLGQKLTSLRIMWRILGPGCFARGLLLRLRARLLGARDPRSVAGAARKLGIPVYQVGDPNSGAFREQLRGLELDAVLNQSELLLKQATLAVPRLGFVNRHASLLPEFRGRLASFWSHAADPPRHGVTIHMVDQGLDTGPVILRQERNDLDPRQGYCRVARELFSGAPELFWRAMDRLAQPGFTPEPQDENRAGKARAFPTLAEARAYRRLLARRRSGKGADSGGDAP